MSKSIFDIILKDHKKMKKSNKNKSTTNVWGKLEDNKLRSLFETKLSKGGVNPEDIAKATLEKVIRKHFPDRNYHSFRQLFRRKALKFLLGASLSGRRKEAAGK